MTPGEVVRHCGQAPERDPFRYGVLHGKALALLHLYVAVIFEPRSTSAIAWPCHLATSRKRNPPPRPEAHDSSRYREVP